MPARQTDISEQTVRRVLIEAGDSPQQIAEALHISVKTVNAYSPYTRGSYRFGEKSENAEKLALWRQNRREQQEKSEGVKK